MFTRGGRENRLSFNGRKSLPAHFVSTSQYLFLLFTFLRHEVCSFLLLACPKAQCGQIERSGLGLSVYAPELSSAHRFINIHLFLFFVLAIVLVPALACISGYYHEDASSDLILLASSRPLLETGIIFSDPGTCSS